MSAHNYEIKWSMTLQCQQDCEDPAEYLMPYASGAMTAVCEGHTFAWFDDCDYLRPLARKLVPHEFAPDLAGTDDESEK